jgi:NAD+ kinase
MATVGFVVHCTRPRAATAAKEAVAWLTDRGHSPRVVLPDAEEIGLAEWGFAQEDFVPGLDLVVSIGGDGTMLRAMHLVVAHGVPVLGVSMGRLAYLTVVEPEQLTTALEGFLAGEHQIEERMTLAVDVDAPSGSVATGTYVACNEVVAEKPSSGHTVHVAVDINGAFFTSYAADGLIVATPTGSTAYALSARGPIISPTHRALLLTPVAPHMLFDRSLVLDAAERVRVEVIDERPAALTIDGVEMGMLQQGDAVTCRAGAPDARLVTLGPRNFHRILKTKFGLADR